jgi:hypothetical protein
VQESNKELPSLSSQHPSGISKESLIDRNSEKVALLFVIE